MKRAIAVIFVALFCVFSFSFSAMAADGNLLPNGGFENVAENGVPEQWYPTAYRSQDGYSRLSASSEKAYSGRFSAMVENASSNDARFTCTVKVRPESLYRLSGYVLVESMEDTGNGANFGIEGIYSFSDGLFDTNGEWQYLEWYGETGEDQNEVTIGIRVGGYSAESTGKAYFDDMVLEEVDSLPEHIIASLWYNAYPDAAASKSEGENNQKNTGLYVLLAGVYLLVVVIGTSAVQKESSAIGLHVATWIALAGALMLRIFLSTKIPGYEVDINCFTAWSMRMASKGPCGFYAPDYFCDYPPGAMLLLWPIGVLLNAAGLQNQELALLIVKLLPILSDFLCAGCLYAIGKKHFSVSMSAIVAVLYLLNPAVLVNGAAWGQMDSVLAFFVLLTTFAAMKRDWRKAIPLFVVSALIKPQALLFAPLGAVALASDYCQQKEQRREMIQKTGWGVFFAFAAAFVIILPFSLQQEEPFTWLITLYGKTLGSYNYATLNTANVYYLSGANWTPLEQSVPAGLLWPSVGVLATAVLLMRLEKVRRCFSDKRILNYLTWIFSMTAAVLAIMGLCKAGYQWHGYAMMAFVYLFAIGCFANQRHKGALPYCMALALIGVYVLGIKVHERYLFPALCLLLVSYLVSHDKRVLWLAAVFSLTTFLNTAVVLENSILFGAEHGHLNTDTQPLNLLLCISNLLFCIWTGWIGITGLRASTCVSPDCRAAGDRNASYRQMLVSPKDHRLHLSWCDYVLMGITTLAYAVLAFCNLGSRVAPQTAHVSTSPDEQIVFQLEEDTTFSVLYYGGVSYNDFAIAVSDDGLQWSDTYPCEMREGLCYRWNYALKSTNDHGKATYPTANPGNVLWLTGKYLRVDACNAGLNLWEIVARDQDGNNLPLKLVSQTHAKPELLNENKPAENLIDEMDTCSGEPGWYTGTYFDEIYHARTAYEHLHGQAPYETTHPPLGKLLIAAGIALFGMTPFGWRFAGALIGVLMLPAIYLLAMQLTHKRTVAAISMFGLAFDLMHFTQTRIATIDSFPVFFILLTYLFMVRYMQMDSFAVEAPGQKLLDRSYLKTLLPLLACGICMGLSIASKWIGIYSAIGLAVLFFLTMYRQARVCETAWQLEDGEENEVLAARIQSAKDFTLPRIAITCGFCVIFFVLIPCLIYAACYIPYLSPTGPVTLKRIINAQIGMLNYHSTPGLGMDHPFQSPWWQWPLILKPMWFAQDQFEPAGFASTILCFGNPWVFYAGAAAMVTVLVCSVARYFKFQDNRLVLRAGNGDLHLAVLAIAFLAQYLPWVLVPRSMYMYHYFASVPFIIMATAYLLELLPRQKPLLRYGVIGLYLTGTIIFFVMFFPYASGYLTPTNWLDAMKWFSRLYY